MLFNFCIQTKHFITKQSKFFKKMNYFIKILYPNTLLGNSWISLLSLVSIAGQIGLSTINKKSILNKYRYHEQLYINLLVGLFRTTPQPNLLRYKN